jgi:hypothetical protein
MYVCMYVWERCPTLSDPQIYLYIVVYEHIASLSDSAQARTSVALGASVPRVPQPGSPIHFVAPLLYTPTVRRRGSAGAALELWALGRLNPVD